MAMEIDRLEIAINAQARNATSEIDALYSKLGDVADRLNRSSSSFRSATKEMGRLTAAFRALANVRIPHFDAILSQINALSVALGKLQGKKVAVDVAVNVPKSASQLQWALEKAADSAKIDSDAIANQLINEYALKNKAASAVKSAVADMARELSAGFDGSTFQNSTEVLNTYFFKIEEIIREHGKIASVLIEDTATLMSDKYSDFVANKGIDKIKTKISDIANNDVASNATSIINDSIFGAFEKSKDSVRTGFADAMKVASNELTLDIEVNQDKIVRDIRNAITKATSIEYTAADVKIKVDKRNITDSVTNELKNISAGNLPAIADAYEKLFGTISTVHTALGNSNSINNVVNALARLARVDLGKFEIWKFREIVSAITSMTSMGDVSSSITKLVSALARLANVGDNMKQTSIELPVFAERLRNAFESLSGVNIDEITERVLSAFTRLATSGQKAEIAAQNLPNITAAVREFFDSMAQAPLINDTTLRMVESFTALATTGKRIGSVGNQIAKSFKDVDNAGARTVRTFQSVGVGSNKVLDAFRKLLAACKNVASGIGKGAAKIISHFKNIGNGSNHIQKATLSLKNLLQVAIGFYGIRTLFNWGKDAIEFASDLTEVQNVVENSFGTEGTKLIERYADTAREKFGMSELTFKQIASRYQAMGNAMGITTGQIAKANERLADKMVGDYKEVGDGMGNMSTRLTMLAADMASFYNVEQSTVAEALNAVYTGQTRPLRQYGLDLTQATLQEWAAKQGIEGKVSAMSQAEKTMLRYQYVLAQTNTIQGDFARTSDTWANQVRLLKQNLQALGGVVGGTLINAFKPFITWLNKALGAVIAFAETVGNALGKIFGWKILHTPASNAADAYDTLADGLEDAGSSGDDAADGIGKATKAAEEYKNTVAGFDELNKLNDVTKSGSGSGGSGSGSGSGSGAGDGVGDGTGADFELVKADSWLEAYKSDIDSLYELGSYISGVLTKAMESIDWYSIYEKARNFGTGLADFLNGLITPELFSAIGHTIAGALNTQLNAEEAFLDKFDFTNLGNSIAAGLNRFFNDWDANLQARVFYKSINGIADTIKAACDEIEWNKIGNKISACVRTALANIDWEGKVYPAAQSFGKGIAEFLNGLIKPSTFWKIGETISAQLNTALHILDTFGHTFDFANFGESVASAIGGFFENWDADLTADTFNTLANGILTSIGTALDSVNWKRIGAKISGMIANIEWLELLKNVGNVIMKAINSALDLASGLFDGTPISDAIDGLKQTINDIAGQIDFNIVAGGLRSIFDVGSKFAEGFLGGLTTAFGVLVDFGVGTLTGIGFALGIIGEALNKIDPEWVKKLGFALGIFAAAMITMKGCDTVAGIITNVKNAFLGVETAGAAAATGASAAAGGVAEAGAAATGSTTATTGLLKALVTSTGFLEGAAITGVVSWAKRMQEGEEKTLGFNGKLTEMGGIIDTLAINYLPEMQGGLRKLNDDLENNDASVEEASTAFANFFKGEHIDPKVLQTALGSARGSMSLTCDQMDLLDQIWEKFNGTTDTSSGKISGWANKIEGAKAVAESASGIKDTIGGAFDTAGEKAEGADKKTGLFSTNIGGFAAGALAQSILLAVLGTSFATMGDKADGAQTPVGNLQTKVGEFVDGVKGWASDALSNSKAVGDNTVKGMTDSITDGKTKVDDAVKSAMVTTPQNTLTSNWGIHSPSTVTYGYGENIINGMLNAIKEKGTSLTEAIQSIVADMKKSITDKFGEFRQAGLELSENFKTGFKSIRFNDLTAYIWGEFDFNRLYENMRTVGHNVAVQFSNGMQSVHIKTPHVTLTQSVSGEGESKTISWSSSVSWYGKGGFPNVGDLFIANEKKPEMIGRMGNRNTVANNLQIEKGIRAAVVDGMMQVFMATSLNKEETPIVVHSVLKTENDEVLARAVERGKAKRDMRFNTVAFG